MTDEVLYPDCMVDTETTGTRADRNGLLQISAVRFNLKTQAVDHNFFDECLWIPPWRSWDEGTKTWWGTQKRDVLQSILSRAQDPAQVMDRFVAWAAPANSMRMWAKPSHFDFNFIASYCTDFNLPVPFHYRNVTDMRSFIDALTFPNEPFDQNSVVFDGDVHNALFDVLHQIKVLFEAVKARG